ncbi:major facilitator superfamily domain-containing protein [Lipomyces starkeyi]|uniref:Major facilitator superfamily (MFS) profile domain-containing protein n=1 Tax=Lipomyces starkeyi NRRL Y-11557 TaxID=675824 RepID=A0A1E3PV42_LIPST|nr:hypothetical protein LIPSTDRAFT_120931 [Lipomyces starkeyi NRRL Y-11557]
MLSTSLLKAGHLRKSRVHIEVRGGQLAVTGSSGRLGMSHAVDEMRLQVLKTQQFTKDNHDLIFMILPSFCRDHFLRGSSRLTESLEEFQSIEHGDIDVDLAKYTDGRAPVEIDAALNKELFWKVNKRILVVMLGTYFCQSLDKSTLGFSSVMGIKMTRIWLLPIAKYLSVNVFCWGAVICCSAAAQDFGGLMTVRFLLGVYVATKEEQAILTSFWYCMVGVQLMVGGIIAFGVSHYTHGVIKSWQLLFLVLGLEEKVLFIERVQMNETGIQNTKLKRYQMVEALIDSLVWCYVLLQVSSTLIIGDLGVFSSLIISSFGFSYLQTQLPNIAQGGITIIVMEGSAALATKLKDTVLVMLIWTLPAIAGTAVIVKIVPNDRNRVGLIAFYCTQFFLAQGNLIFSLISRNIAGTGNMAAPHIFRNNDAPRYKHGFIAYLCLYIFFVVVLGLTRLIIIHRNADKVKNDVGVDKDSPEHHIHAFDDLTDRENPAFRYSV